MGALVGDHRHGRATDIAGANAGNLLDCVRRGRGSAANNRREPTQLSSLRCAGLGPAGVFSAPGLSAISVAAACGAVARLGPPRCLTSRVQSGYPGSHAARGPGPRATRTRPAARAIARLHRPLPLGAPRGGSVVPREAECPCLGGRLLPHRVSCRSLCCRTQRCAHTTWSDRANPYVK